MISQRLQLSLPLCITILASASLAEAGILRVEVATSRSNAETVRTTTEAFRSSHSKLEAMARKNRSIPTKFFLPQRVELTRNGAVAPFTGVTRGATTGLTLQFDPAGATPFPTDYRAFLESVWAAAEPIMTATYGAPANPGIVKVINDDATISDRRAVAGGYYVPNAVGGPEVRLPVNLDSATAALNFIHSVLLAYQGATPYPFDVYGEGLVRACVMKIARTPGALPPSIDSNQVEAALSSLYHVDDRYEWLNQPALGGPTFIAPNLLNQPLPVGGSTGGIFLLRHQMAASAFGKVLVQFPAFAAEFNRRYYLNPSSGQTEAGMVLLAQTSINAIAGGGSESIEGLTFNNWHLRHSIFDTTRSPGLKLLVEPTALTPLNSTDFGVFDIVAHAFTVDANGNETLLTSTAYPIYFRQDFTRNFLSAQDDVISINNGYGSVTPNFPREATGGVPYIATVDVPFRSEVQRVRVPAGAMFAGSGARNDVAGTVSEQSLDNTTYSVLLSYAGKSAGPFPVQNGVFFGSVADDSFDQPNSVVVTLRRVVNSIPSTVFTRIVNKGKGSLVVDLRPPATFGTFTLSLPNRLALVGVGIQPYRPSVLQMTQFTAENALVSRYDSVLGRYRYYPELGTMSQGQGFFTREYTSRSTLIHGRLSRSEPTVVPLQPGWNMISNPLGVDQPVADLKATTTSLDFSPWASSVGDTVGGTVFFLTADPLNPNVGTFTPITTIGRGQAAFVRCVSSNGAALLFGTTNNARSVLQSSKLAIDKGEWQAGLTFQSDMLQRSSVIVGQRLTATTTESRALDMPLPPSNGGFQAVVSASGRYYQKFMPLTATAPITVVMENLPVGRWITVTTRLSGAAKRAEIQSSSGQIWSVTDGGKFRFKATATTMSFGVRPR